MYFLLPRFGRHLHGLAPEFFLWRQRFLLSREVYGGRFFTPRIPHPHLALARAFYSWGIKRWGRGRGSCKMPRFFLPLRCTFPLSMRSKGRSTYLCLCLRHFCRLSSPQFCGKNLQNASCSGKFLRRLLSFLAYSFSHSQQNRKPPMSFFKHGVVRLIGVFLAVIFGATALFFFIGGGAPAPQIAWGVNFSSQHAEKLGLDPQETYRAL